VAPLTWPPNRAHQPPEIGVPKLALDDDQRHALARHLDRVLVPELMRSKASAHPRCDRSVAELHADSSR
jgi:hypothetical protein